MQQKFTQEADFRQERDFGAKINATFEFLGVHWRPLGRCLLYFVVPPAMLMGLVLGIAQSQTLNLIGQEAGARAERLTRMSKLYDLGLPIYWLGILISGVSYLLLGATVYGYVRARTSLPPEQEVTPRLVWEQVRSLAPRLLLSTIMTIVLVLIGCALLLVPGIYLGVALSLIWAVQTFEGKGLNATLNRNLSLISGKWWSTLGLYFVMSLLIGLFGMILQVPQYLTMFGKLLHWEWLSSNVLMVAANIVASVGQMLLYTPLLLALMFQYFNLVERKDGVGLRALVNSLGTGAAPVAYNAAYRPDNEGEY